LPIPYPEQVVENIATIANTGNGSPQIDVHGDTIVYNLLYHDEIYRFIDNEITVHTVPSQFYPESDPAMLNAMPSREAFKKVNRFSAIQYDPYRNLYMLFHYNKTGGREQRPSVTFLSTDLKVIAEVLLPEQLRTIFFFRPEAIYAAVASSYLGLPQKVRFMHNTNKLCW